MGKIDSARKFELECKKLRESARSFVEAMEDTWGSSHDFEVAGGAGTFLRIDDHDVMLSVVAVDGETQTINICDGHMINFLRYKLVREEVGKTKNYKGMTYMFMEAPKG
jgi:hypothetical protein